MQEKPLGIALVVCDQMMTEAISGKTTLVGVCNALTLQHFPFTHPAICVFAQLSNGQGSTPIQIRLVQDATGKVLSALEAKATFPDPTRVIELKTVFRQIVFPAAGTYSFELYCGDDLVIETRILLAQAGAA
jgi:hypothetical protein